MKKVRKIARKLAKPVIILCPVILVTGQVFSNLLYVGAPDIFADWYNLISACFGFNFISGISIVAWALGFNFCYATIFCGLAQILFGVVYLAIPDKEEYNLAVQVIVGIAALLLTLITFVIQNDRQWTSRQSLQQ